LDIKGGGGKTISKAKERENLRLLFFEMCMNVPSEGKKRERIGGENFGKMRSRGKEDKRRGRDR